MERIYKLDATPIKNGIEVNAGQWAPALPFQVDILVVPDGLGPIDTATLSRGEATTLYHCLGRALGLE